MGCHKLDYDEYYYDLRLKMLVPRPYMYTGQKVYNLFRYTPRKLKIPLWWSPYCAIAVDSSTPIRWAGIPSSGTGITSASFTAPANSFLLACVQGDSDVGSGTTVSITDSGSLTWTTRVERGATEATDGGSSHIYTAPQVTSAARTATTTFTYSLGSGRIACKLYVVTGVDITGTPVDTVGASNEGGSTANNTTTTNITPGANGLLFVNNCDWTATGGFTSSDLTIETATYSGQIAACSGYKTCTSGVGVTGNLNALGSSPVQDKWCQVIVRESPPALSGAMKPSLAPSILAM